MKAMVRTEYGSPDVLSLQEVDKPIPKAGEVLIRVGAASINASDTEGLQGKPLYARIDGPFRPRTRILGSDVAGTVVAIGEGVEQFQVGNVVFGDTLYHGAGAFAEYVRVKETAPLVIKPPHLAFEQAATLPQSAVIALQAITERVQSGSKVLVNGAGGGAGTFAIQLAKAAGAEVTGVDNEWKQEHMRAQGADRVIDYRREDYTDDRGRYDFILDLACHRSIFAIARALASGGRYAVVGGSVAALLQAAVLGPLLGRKKRLGVLVVRPNKGDLERAAALVGDGTLRPVIDRVFPLAELPEALAYVAEGRAKGKVVISSESASA
jgi:NADPH:quinone reductase-like Zn-dependent oxidoreductase